MDHLQTANLQDKIITLELYFKGERKFHAQAQAQALDPFVLAFWKKKTEPAMEKTCLGFIC
jgi:hypothetical protein